MIRKIKNTLLNQFHITISFKHSKKCDNFMTKLVPIILLIFTLSALPQSGSFCKARGVTYGTNSRNPAMVWYTNSKHISIPKSLTCYNGSKVIKCNVYPREAAPKDPEAYLFNGYDIDTFPLPRDSKTIWALYQDDSPKTKPMLMYEEALNLFNFSSTFSRHSDVPKLLLWMNGVESIVSTEFFVNTARKNSLLHKIAPVVFFQKDCFTFTEREEYVKELNKYIKVDSYGGCHDKDLLIPYNNNVMLTEEELNKLLARYKFQISIENAVCNDYITEKLWRALEVGTVPIYYGSPLIRDWLPNNKSAILLEDFPTPKLLSEHLHYLLQNDTAYEEYLKHKTLGLISNQKLIDYEIRGSMYDAGYKFNCLICKRIHDRNSTRVNIVTKKHYDCLTPNSTLTFSVNLNNNTWQNIVEKADSKVDQIIKEIQDPNRTRRSSNTSWNWNCLFIVNRKDDAIECYQYL